MQLEIVADDRLASPVDDGFDLVIRVNPVSDDQLVGPRFLRDEQLVVTPPGMAAPPGYGEHPLRAVALPTAASEALWRMRDRPGVTYRPEAVSRLSSLLLVRDAVLAGAGAALLPRMIVAGARPDRLRRRTPRSSREPGDRPMAQWYGNNRQHSLTHIAADARLYSQHD